MKHCLFAPALLLALNVSAQIPLGLRCPPPQTHFICGGSFAFVTYPLPTASNGCPTAATVTCVPPSGGAFTLGTTTVNCTATNACREGAACSFPVTVAWDRTPPSLPCPGDLEVWVAATNGLPVPPVQVEFEVSATDAAPGAVNVVCAPPSGSLFPLGPTPVACTATDACTNRATCTFLVIVRADTNAPTLQCPTNVIVWTCDTNGVPVSFPAPVATDDADPSPMVACVPPSGSLFSAGTTSVICTATDASGKQSRCSFEVWVGPDPIPPTLTCPPDLIRLSCSTNGRTVAFNLPTADDNDNAAPTVACVPPPNSVFPSGITIVTCTATDACGNQTQCAFNVIVAPDTEPPSIVCPGHRTVDTCDYRGVRVTWPDPEVVDNYIINPQYSCTPPSGSLFPIGATTVTCQAEDSCGNLSQCTFTVTVRGDTSLPGTDTDGNGLSDIWEVHFEAQGLAPDGDADGDGLSNADEAKAGTSPFDPSFRGGVRVAVGDISGDGLGDGSVRPMRFSVKAPAVFGKLYQLQAVAQLGDAWMDIGPPQRPRDEGFEQIVDLGDTNLPPGFSAQGFFRVSVADVDEDQDGLTAWEESIIGTSDLTPDSPPDEGGAGVDILIGNTGGDRQKALDWIAGKLGKARLREVALAHIGGSPNGPTQTKLATATGTGGWLKLSSWTLDPGTHDPTHLQDTAPFEGWNAKLEVLEPPQSPTLTLNPFVSGRLRHDENLWLTVRRVDAAGNHNEFSTLGYGANASLRVYDYAMAHQPVTGSGVGVESYLLVTPVMGLNTANQPELRVVAWSIAPNSGAIHGVFDTGNLGHTNLPEKGGRLQIVREGGGRYVVSYLDRYARLSSWFFDVNASGAVFARGGATSGVDIRGEEMDPILSTDFALGTLNGAGFVTLLGDTNCSARFAVWEDRVVACDAACYARPFYITDNTLDLRPDDPGVVIAPPQISDSWDDTAIANDRFGRALAVGDFNGDGAADLALGIPEHDVSKENDPTASAAGEVFILHGHADGLRGEYPDRAWSQDSDGIVGVADSEDRFGQALATGDFNGDGFADLAIGVPGEEVDGVAKAGAVNVLYGSASGLRANGNQIWYQGASGLPGTPGDDAQFGYALTTGDFNGDGYADLAIGIPYETVSGLEEAGAVQVIYGSAGGLSAAAGPGEQLLHQGNLSPGAPDEDDGFGLSLAAGDINGDGRDDLVVGIPLEDVGGLNAGAVQVIFGSANGLLAQGQLVTQGTIAPSGGAFPAASEAGDLFGWSLAVGDFNNDGYADVAIGVPYENLENWDIADAGVVHILRGSASGLTAVSHQLLVQAIPEHSDLAGLALTVGDFNGDGYADLAVASPEEDVINNTVINAGAVDIYEGGANGLSFGTSFYQGALGNGGYAETAEGFDRFGYALAAGDLNGDGRDDLAVGVPEENLIRGDEENRVDAGVVHAIYGSDGGLTGDGDQVWAQGEPFRVRALLTDQQREAAKGIGGGKLFEKMPAGERTNVHVASVTKCMTLLLAAELLDTPGANVSLNDIVPVSSLAAGTGGSKMEPPYGPVLETDDEMPLELLLYGMMLRSCNKSSVVIGEHLARKQYQFLHGALPGDFNANAYFITNMMQGKADAVGLANTLCGHPAGGMITTPQDLGTLWHYAWPFAEFRRIATDTIYSGSGEDKNGAPKNYFLEKHSSGDGYPGLEGWKGGNGGLWSGGAPFGIPYATSSVLGQATRLERSLTFALQQTGSRWGDTARMLDYGYRALFTPDHRGSGGINTPTVNALALRRVHDTLAVSAVIYGTNTLRLDAWQVVAGIGQASSLNHSTLNVTGLQPGTHGPHVKVFDLTRLPSVGESEADYLTGRLDGGQLRLNVWRVAAEPGF